MLFPWFWWFLGGAAGTPAPSTPLAVLVEDRSSSRYVVTDRSGSRYRAEDTSAPRYTVADRSIP